LHNGIAKYDSASEGHGLKGRISVVLSFDLFQTMPRIPRTTKGVRETRAIYLLDISEGDMASVQPGLFLALGAAYKPHGPHGLPYLYPNGWLKENKMFDFAKSRR
jgi:hypothetical protein